MSERKYKFERPKGQDEHLEAIYEELLDSPSQDSWRRRNTLKDCLVALLAHARSVERNREDEKADRAHSVGWALGALAFLAFVFLCNGAVGSSDWAWLDSHRFAVKLWGIVFAAVYVGVSIERTSFFRSLWAFGFTKIVASLAVSALFVFSTGKASSLMNAVFPVDASAMPFTRAILTGVVAFQYSYPLLIVVALFAVGHAFNAIGWVKLKWSSRETYESPPVQSMAFLILALVVLGFSATWVNSDFSANMMPSKAYRLAHALDFNSKYECSNLRKGLSVVFLGPDQARVLVDVNSINTDDMESFVVGPISQVDIPQQFYVLPCDLTLPKKEG